MQTSKEEGSFSFQSQIQASHERARTYGVNPMKLNPFDQPHLSMEALRDRREENRDFLAAASLYIQEIQRSMEISGFISAIVDSEGYVLRCTGEIDLVKYYNKILGTRWTERDIGTSAISMALRHKKPMQITAKEHYCRQSQNNTCSAAPVFGGTEEFIGVIAVSGRADKVHPHTLGMVTTAARAIENHLRISQASKELVLKNDFMEAVLESIDSGVMAVDKNGRVIQINEQGKQILKHAGNILDQHLSSINGARQDWLDVVATGLGYMDREVFIRTNRGNIQLMVTAKAILDAFGMPEGVIFVFNEINRIRRLVNQMAGSQASFTFEDIVGESPAIKEAKRLGVIASAGRSSVLLYGETGTGKELFAQSIHNRSPRKNHPFMAINCGAIPRELLESELFGYAEGAFTGAKSGGRPGKLELADGGTVFLDEVCDMPGDMQVKLLRALQSGEVFRIGQSSPISVEIRIIAASQYDLREQVARGRFRKDLFYRLDVLPVDIPPLRERGADVLLLAGHFLDRWAEIMGKTRMTFSPAAKDTLVRHNWPGNVRELQNLVERAVNLADGNVIEPAHFGTPVPEQEPAPAKHPSRNRLEAAERKIIMETLEETGRNVARTAALLGITRVTLYKRLKKYGLKASGRRV
jgi:sigma-54 dependent transcriptional regulator, acetoin dehydrogenase operon transcriptional activator AcoR